MSEDNNNGHPLSSVERETKAAVERLLVQVEDALGIVSGRSYDAKDLEQGADRLDRAARDLTVALRELAQERRSNTDN